MWNSETPVTSLTCSPLAPPHAHLSRCRDLEIDVTTVKAQLGDKQSVQSENDRLKLQIDSVQAQIQIEQKKAAEDR